MITAIARLRHLPIERTCSLDPEIFEQRYLTGIGKPIIVTDALNSWPALSKWSFEFFKTRYGSDHIAPRTWAGPDGMKFQKLMTLAEFIDYMDAPGMPPPGLWVKSRTLHPC